MNTNGKLLPIALSLAAILLVACSAEAGKEQKPAAASEPANIFAYLGGEPITGAEVDEMIRGQLMKIHQEEYDARRQAIEQVALQKMLSQEAESRGITEAELFNAEVQAKTPEPTDEQIQQTWDRNKNDPRLKGKTLEELRPAIVAQLQRQFAAQRRDEYLRGLLAKAELEMVLEPPRAEVAVPASAPSKGPKDAPITIVEFSDFQCPYCKRSQEAVDQLLAEYGDRIHFVYRDFPLSFHQQATPAAIAARCAGDQGKYWQYHDSLMQEQGDLKEDDLKKRAESVGLDLAAFNGCVESERHADAVSAGIDDGSKLGVTGTPTFFINGRMMVGGQTLETLRKVVEEELARAGKSS